MESLAHAKKRGANILGEYLGGGPRDLGEAERGAHLLGARVRVRARVRVGVRNRVRVRVRDRVRVRRGGRKRAPGGPRYRGDIGEI